MSSGVTADTNTSAAMKAGSSATATVLQGQYKSKQNIANGYREGQGFGWQDR